MPADELNKKNDIVDYMVLTVFLIGVFTFIYYRYSMDVWYLTKVYLFLWISHIPDFLMNTLFFWYDNEHYNVVQIHKLLSGHSMDYIAYFSDGDVGQVNFKIINQRMNILILPYVFLFLLVFLVPEFKKKYSKINPQGVGRAMYDYALSQREVWPYIKVVTPIMRKIAESKNLDEGWYAMSKMPLMFLKENGALNVVKRERRKLITVKQKHELILNKKKVFNILMRNLGKQWVSLQELTFTEKCILAVIVPHIYGRIKESRLINRKICSYHDPLLTKKELSIRLAALEIEVELIIKEYEKSFITPYFNATEFDDPYDPIISSFEKLSSEDEMFKKGDKLIRDTLLTHAYFKTILFSLIKKSWTYGVLSSSELLWVKSVDRELFYVLSQQGRHSAFVEVCGAWAHYLAEDSYGFRILAPQVFEGVRALDYELWKTHTNYIPCESWEDLSKWDRLVPDVYQKNDGLSNEDNSIGSEPI